MTTHRNTCTRARAATAACLGMACALPVLAQSMKSSNETAGLKVNFGCATAPVQIDPKAIDRPREDAFRKPSQARQAMLNIGSSTTWVVDGGDPLMVTYCVAPAVQSVGNAPWTTPVQLQLVDNRTVEYVNEDPYAKDILTPKKAPKVPLIPSPHQQAQFTPVTLALPVIPGPWIAVPVAPANAWCRTVAWYQRPDLQIQATGNGVSASCPVQFNSPLSRIKANRASTRD